MSESTYTIQGMTCQHCVRSVTEEVGEIDGVQGVEVDLATGRIVVRGETTVPAEKVAAAVAEAGYRLVG